LRLCGLCLTRGIGCWREQACLWWENGLAVTITTRLALAAAPFAALPLRRSSFFAIPAACAAAACCARYNPTPRRGALFSAHTSAAIPAAGRREGRPQALGGGWAGDCGAASALWARRIKQQLVSCFVDASGSCFSFYVLFRSSYHARLRRCTSLLCGSRWKTGSTYCSLLSSAIIFSFCSDGLGLCCPHRQAWNGDVWRVGGLLLPALKPSCLPA